MLPSYKRDNYIISHCCLFWVIIVPSELMIVRILEEYAFINFCISIYPFAQFIAVLRMIVLAQGSLLKYYSQHSSQCLSILHM